MFFFSWVLFGFFPLFSFLSPASSSVAYASNTFPSYGTLFAEVFQYGPFSQLHDTTVSQPSSLLPVPQARVCWQKSFFSHTECSRTDTNGRFPLCLDCLKPTYTFFLSSPFLEIQSLLEGKTFSRYLVLNAQKKDALWSTLKSAPDNAAMNVFWHANSMRNALNERWKLLGTLPRKGRSYVFSKKTIFSLGPLSVTTARCGGAGACTGSDARIVFGYELAHDPEIIYHEYGHAQIFDVINRSLSDEERAVFPSPVFGAYSEGGAEYLAATIGNDPFIYNVICDRERIDCYSLQDDFDLRSFIESSLDRGDYPDPHGVGMALAHPFWKIRESLGAESADSLFLLSLWRIAERLHGEMIPPRPPYIDFLDMRDSVLQADREIFGGKNQSIILSAFSESGVSEANPFVFVTPKKTDYFLSTILYSNAVNACNLKITAPGSVSSGKSEDCHAQWMSLSRENVPASVCASVSYRDDRIDLRGECMFVNENTSSENNSLCHWFSDQNDFEQNRNCGWYDPDTTRHDFLVERNS